MHTIYDQDVIKRSSVEFWSKSFFRVSYDVPQVLERRKMLVRASTAAFVARRFMAPLTSVKLRHVQTFFFFFFGL